MTTDHTRPSPTVQQISGYDPEMNAILAVVAKRTYRILPNGLCIQSDDQLPLMLDVEYDSDCPGRLTSDLDIFPMKPATDLVVKGHAYSLDEKRTVEASIRVGKRGTNLRVIGERRCTLSSSGRIVFSEPEPFEKIPLRYDRAYGGSDVIAEKKYGNPYEGLRKYLPRNIDLSQCSAFTYPRNPIGRGYLLEPTADALKNLQLPNLEDPADPLTPERIIVEELGRWPLMPLPRSTDWVDHLWFPRIVYFGFIPDHTPLDGIIAEVAQAWAPTDLMVPGDQTKKFSFRFTNGASLGLQFPFLRGDEQCELLNLHPRLSHFRFQLPGEIPRIWTDGRKGKLNSTNPVVHTVLIEPDESRVSIVWSGSAPALRPYSLEELEKMPLRVEWP